MLKGLFKFIIVLVLMVVVLVGGTVLVVYLSIHDNTNDIPYELYQESISMDNEINYILSASLDGIEETEKFQVAITEEIMNRLLFGILRNTNSEYMPTEDCQSDACRYVISQPLGEFASFLGDRKVALLGVYSEFTENTLEIIAVIDLAGIASTVRVATEFSLVEDTYQLEITKLSLGKINLARGIGRTILSAVLNNSQFTEDDINDYFTEANIPIEFTMANFTFSFQQSSLKEVITGLFGSQEDSYEIQLFQELVGVLVDADNALLEIGFFEATDDYVFGFSLDLSQLTYNELEDGPMPIGLDFSDIQSKLKTLLDGEIITQDQIELTNRFLLYGYQALSFEEQSTIDTLDFTAIGIASKMAYVPLIPESTFDITTLFTDQLNQGLMNLNQGEMRIELDASDINELLYSFGLVGMGKAFYYTQGLESRLLYTGVEGVWVSIGEDEIRFHFVYYLSGLRLSLFTSFVNTSTDPLIIEAQLDQLRLGELDLPDTIQSAVLSFFENFTQSDESAFALIGFSNQSILIDGNDFLVGLENGADSFISQFMDLLRDNGMLNLRLQASSGFGKLAFVGDLSKLTIDEEREDIPNEVSDPVDASHFSRLKTQSIVFTDLSASTHMYYSNEDFNQMLYENTNGYQDFSYEFALSGTADVFMYQLQAIFLSFTEEEVIFEFLMNINGLKSIIELIGDVEDNNTTSVKIVLRETLTFGKDPGESPDAYATYESEFLLDIIETQLISMDLIEYDPVLQAFILSHNTLAYFLNVNQDNTSPLLSSDRIEILDGGVAIYTTYEDVLLETALNSATSAVEFWLSTHSLVLADFDTTDATQANNVAQFLTTLNTLAGMAIPSDVVTSSLIVELHQLSKANQAVFLDAVEANTGGLLSALYDLIF